QQEVTLAMVAGQGKEIREQPVQRLDRPAQTDDGKKKAGLGSAQPHVLLEEILHRLVGEAGSEIDNSLDKVDNGKEEGIAPDLFVQQRLRSLLRQEHGGVIHDLPLRYRFPLPLWERDRVRGHTAVTRLRRPSPRPSPAPRAREKTRASTPPSGGDTGPRLHRLVPAAQVRPGRVKGELAAAGCV